MRKLFNISIGLCFLFENNIYKFTGSCLAAENKIIHQKNFFMETIETRLKKLEKNNRLYRFFFITITTFGIIYFFTFGRQPAPDVITAKSFQVVDNDGKVLAQLGNDYSAGTLKLYDNNGNKIVNLIKNTEGAGAILLYDSRGQFTWSASSTTGGGGWMGIYNSDGNEVFSSGCTKKNTGYLFVNNQKGDYMFRVTYTEGVEGGWLGLYNGDGKNTILSMSPTSNNDGVINFYNRSNTRIVSVGGTPTGDGAVSTWNGSGGKSGNLPQ